MSKLSPNPLIIKLSLRLREKMASCIHLNDTYCSYDVYQYRYQSSEDDTLIVPPFSSLYRPLQPNADVAGLGVRSIIFLLFENDPLIAE